MYVSPQPPSAICFPSRKLHARLTRSELACVSPAIPSDSSANIVAYVKQTPLDHTSKL